MYDSSTWTMYHLITTARSRRMIESGGSLVELSTQTFYDVELIDPRSLLRGRSISPSIHNTDECDAMSLDGHFIPDDEGVFTLELDA